MGKSSSNTVPNVERALQVFELLSENNEGMLVSQVAAELGIPRNSVFRICSTLREHGYIDSVPNTSKVRLTKKLFSVGYKALCEENIVQVSRDEMRKLRDEVKETVLIGTLLESSGAVLEEFAGLHHFNFRVERGASFYLHCTAPGKALLAFLSKAEQARIVDTIQLIRFNENTITKKSALLDQLDTIRSTGVSYDYAEQIEGCHCIASPVLDQYGYPVAAIWLTGPSSRLPVSDFPAIGKRMKNAAANISAKLGYQTTER